MIAPFLKVAPQLLEPIAKLFQRFGELPPERLVPAVVFARLRLAQILNLALNFRQLAPKFAKFINHLPVTQIVQIARLPNPGSPSSKVFEFESQQL